MQTNLFPCSGHISVHFPWRPCKCKHTHTHPMVSFCTPHRNSHLKFQKFKSPSRDSVIQSTYRGPDFWNLCWGGSTNSGHPAWRSAQQWGDHLQFTPEALAGLDLRASHQIRCRKGGKAEDPGRAPTPTAGKGKVSLGTPGVLASSPTSTTNFLPSPAINLRPPANWSCDLPKSNALERR